MEHVPHHKWWATGPENGADSNGEPRMKHSVAGIALLILLSVAACGFREQMERTEFCSSTITVYRQLSGGTSADYILVCSNGGWPLGKRLLVARSADSVHIDVRPDTTLWAQVFVCQHGLVLRVDTIRLDLDTTIYWSVSGGVESR